MKPFFTRVCLQILKLLSPRQIIQLDTLLHRHFFKDLETAFFPENILYWDNQIYFWGNHPVPIRPSTDEISEYRRALFECLRSVTTSSPPKILILGSTPEIRDLVAQLAPREAEIYLADISYRMPGGMLKLTHFVDPLRERWIRCDWLELPFSESFFDVVIGDLLLQQLPPLKEILFLEKMALMLKKEGMFISRFHFLDTEIHKTTIEEIVRRFNTPEISADERFVLTKFHVLWLFADLEKRTLNRAEAAEAFNEFVVKNHIQDPVLLRVNQSLLFYKDSFRQWSPPSKEALTFQLEKVFTIKSQFVAKDYEDAKYYSLKTLQRV